MRAKAIIPAHFLSLLAGLFVQAHAQSTINPALPAQGSSLSSERVRGNFQAAYNDINNLYRLIAASGASPYYVVIDKFLAKGDGVTNDTTPFANAIASFGGNPGTIILPPGHTYAVNLTITASNIRIVGQGGAKTLVPYSTRLPVIQIGNDSANVQQVRLENFGIDAGGPNGAGTIGIAFKGCSFVYTDGVPVNGFTTAGHYYPGTTTVPTQYIFHSNGLIRPSSSTGDAIYGYMPSSSTYPNGYVTTPYYNNFTMENVTGNSGHLLHSDGVIFHFGTVWMQPVANNQNILFAATNAAPGLESGLVNVDNPNSTWNYVEGYQANQFLSDLISGYFNAGGYFKTSTGTRVPITGIMQIPNQSNLSYPFILGSLSFQDSSAPTFGYNSNFKIYAASGYMYISSNTHLFETAVDAIYLNSPYLSISNSAVVKGNLGVGIGAPGSTLQVNGNAAIGYSASTAAPSNGLAVSGNVGIGTASPGYPLDVAGDIHTSTCLHYATGTLGTCSSDARIKRDVRPFDLGLAAVAGLQPVTFYYNGLGGNPDDGRQQVGLIAQDVEKAAPSLVVPQKVKLHPGDEKATEIKAIDYGAVSYLLINAVKELKAAIDDEKAEIAAMKAANDNQAAALKALAADFAAYKAAHQ